MALLHRFILRCGFPILLALCVLTFPSCDKEHDDLSFTNPIDPDNPITHGDPYNVRVEAQDKSIKVQWDKLSNVDGFVIYRSASLDGDFQEIGASTTGEYEDTSAPPGVTYHYQVRAYRGSKERQTIASALNSRTQAAIKSPPTVKLASNYQAWEKGILKIEAQAADMDGNIEQVRFEYSLNGETWNEIATATEAPYVTEWDTASVVKSSDDSVWVKVTATDDDGLTSEKAVDTSFGVDNEAPWVEEWSRTPDDITEDTSGKLRVSVLVSDGQGSGMARNAPRLDYHIGEETAYRGDKAMTMESKNTWRYDILEPSGGWDRYRGEPIYYKVKLVDAVGNETVSDEQIEIIEDVNDPPSVFITSSFQEWERGTLTLSADASDDDGSVTVRFEYSLDKSNWIPIGSSDSVAPYSVTWDTKASVLGTASAVWIKATATDDDRQSASHTIPNSFSIDNQPPTISHDYDGSWNNKDFVIKLQADDKGGSGVSGISYILNSGSEREYDIGDQESVSVMISAEGADNTLEYWCADKLGNEGKRETLFAIKLDKTKPVFFNWQKAADLSENSSGNFRVSVRVTDDGGSGLGDAAPQLDYRIGTGAQYDGYRDMTTEDGQLWSFDIPEPADGWSGRRGEYVYYKVTTLDVAGNVRESAQQTELIDRMNEPPVITSDPVITATEDQPYTYNVEASDPDIGDTLTYTLTSAPSGMSISSSTGIIAWTPTNDDVRDHSVEVTVSDGDGVVTQSFSVTVINVNDPPEITSEAVTVATEDAAYSYDVGATDPDVGDVLTYSLTTSPSGMDIDTSTGVLTWTPTNDAVGQHDVIVTVSDGNGGIDTQSFTITVNSRDVVNDMVLIPAGEFQMGDSFNEGDSDELPVHTVYLDAFYIDRYEVTNAQYAKFLNLHGADSDMSGNELINLDDPDCLIEVVEYTYRAKSGYENHPVIMVSWYGALAYAEYDGRRLPTEAEWEKAARGGLVGARYPWGDIISHDDANYSGTSGRDVWGRTAPVGSSPPNGYDLYDMAGNVWEWCADWYDSDYYSSSPGNNPTGPTTGTWRVLRGGSWYGYFSYDDLRCAYRNYLRPTSTSFSLGFRCGVSRND